MAARTPRTLAARHQRGVALVELALVLPLLIILSVLVTEFGRAFYQYNSITKGLRDAVRYLSIQDPSIATTDVARLEVARNLVVYGAPTPADGAQPVVPGLSLANVPVDNITWSYTATTPSYHIVRIAVTGYAFQPLIGELFGLRLTNDQGLIAFGPIAAHMRAPE